MVKWMNSLWSNGAIWWHRSGWTLAQEMACCLTAPSHYLNQCWLIIKGVLWHSAENNFTKGAHEFNLRRVQRLHLKLPPQPSRGCLTLDIHTHGFNPCCAEFILENSRHKTFRSSAPGWQCKEWTGKWSVCRSCWIGNNLWELHWFLL